MLKYQDNIKTNLQGALEWMRKPENQQPRTTAKLEARYVCCCCCCCCFQHCSQMHLSYNVCIHMHALHTGLGKCCGSTYLKMCLLQMSPGMSRHLLSLCSLILFIPRFLTLSEWMKHKLFGGSQVQNGNKLSDLMKWGLSTSRGIV